jgi:hypothetical protein
VQHIEIELRKQLRKLEIENRQYKDDLSLACMDNIRCGRELAQHKTQIEQLREENKQLTAKWQAAEAELVRLRRQMEDLE